MALKPFWNRKYHTKLSERELDRLLGFKYIATYNNSSLASIDIKNAQTDSELYFTFKKKDPQLLCSRFGGTSWELFDSYNVPITPQEAQTLLSTGELTQTIDTTLQQILLSPVILKKFSGFYGTLLSVKSNNYCSGIVYEPTLTRKLYFIYIIVDQAAGTASWKLIPAT